MFENIDRFKYLLVNSNGAALHFKQKYTTLQFFCQLMKKLRDAGWKFSRLSWLFGCPGHGKRVWDGLGGVIKGLLFRYIIKEFIVFTDGNAGKKEVYELAKKLFMDNPEIEEKCFKKISKWNTQWQELQTTYRPASNQAGDKIRDLI